MSERLLEIKNLHVMYKTDEDDVYALNGINLHLDKGETLGLVGETGAGKTTIALSVLKLLPEQTGFITDGEIQFDGKDIVHMTEEEMRSILARFGKMTPEDELNCGSCGYATCREKAIAVYNGKADVTMCLPFLREQAENKSSMIIAHSPNGIVAFDADMNVTELNPKAEELFGVDRAEIIGQMIPALYGETAFDEARDYKRTIVKKIEGANEKIRLELSMVYLPQNDMFIAFAKDISDEEANKDQLNNLRMSTVNVAQNVIEKQMRVAQEIASLLGETTAETKVALTRLKRSIEDIEEISE